jgi:hypothetical protein
VLVRSACRQTPTTPWSALCIPRHLPAATTAYQTYQSLFICAAAQGFFLSIFVTATLQILISATCRLYLAKRIRARQRPKARGVGAVNPTSGSIEAATSQLAWSKFQHDGRRAEP